MTCGWKAPQCVKCLVQGKAGDWAELLKKRQAQRVGMREAARLLQRGGAGRGGSQERCATDLAEEHGLPEADYCAS